MEEDQEFGFGHTSLDTFQSSMKIPFICELIHTTCFSVATMFFCVVILWFMQYRILRMYLFIY